MNCSLANENSQNFSRAALFNSFVVKGKRKECNPRDNTNNCKPSRRAGSGLDLYWLAGDIEGDLARVSAACPIIFAVASVALDRIGTGDVKHKVEVAYVTFLDLSVAEINFVIFNT